MLSYDHIVPVCNSCIKCAGSPGIIHDCTPDYHPVSRGRMSPQVPDLTNEPNFASQATLDIDVLSFFLT